MTESCADFNLQSDMERRIIAALHSMFIGKYGGICIEDICINARVSLINLSRGRHYHVVSSTSVTTALVRKKGTLTHLRFVEQSREC